MACKFWKRGRRIEGKDGAAALRGEGSFESAESGDGREKG